LPRSRRAGPGPRTSARRRGTPVCPARRSSSCGPRTVVTGRPANAGKRHPGTGDRRSRCSRVRRGEPTSTLPRPPALPRRRAGLRRTDCLRRPARVPPTRTSAKPGHARWNPIPRSTRPPPAGLSGRAQPRPAGSPR
jgi:hypothetical protein